MGTGHGFYQEKTAEEAAWRPVKNIAVVQSLISSEVALPLDCANAISLCEKLGLPASFHDLNHGDATSNDTEIAYLSSYTVVPYSPQKDFPRIRESLKLIRRNNLRKVIVGGFRFTDDEAKLLLEEGADHVIVGDTISLLAKVLSGNTQKLLVSNRHTSIHEVVPDFRKIPIERYRKSVMARGRTAVPVVFSRGCNIGCSYCPVQAPREQMTLEEIRISISSLVHRNGINHLMIEDDLFNSSPEFVEEFSNLMNREFSTVTWECLNGLHPGIMRPATWEKLSRSKCVHLTLGLECFDQEFLNQRGRIYNLNASMEGVKTLRSAGIPVSGYFLFDFLSDADSGLIPQLRKMKQSPITSFHFSSIRSLTPGERLLWRLSLIYLHLSWKRVFPLYKMGFFSGNYFVRSLMKIIRVSH